MSKGTPTGGPGIAYFSMEIALENDIPTYAGGLGVLAGDTLRSAADLEVPMVGVTLVHRKGYFHQHLDARGNQTESPASWSPGDALEPLPNVVSTEIEGRTVRVRAWRYSIRGMTGHQVPVYLLDTDLPENAEADRALTDHLYGGDQRYRLCQEAILGLGGVALLDAMELDGGLVYHMNEGHSALLTLGLLQLHGDRAAPSGPRGMERVRQQCVFTTHTPVPAGHDRFPVDLVQDVLGPERTSALEEEGCLLDGTLNMTYLALHNARYINGVSMRHGEVSLGMFPDYSIRAITNGVHVPTWVSDPFADLFDRHLDGWRSDNLYLRYAIRIPLQEIREAHRRAKARLLAEIRERNGAELRQDALTLGFARRATPYKRADFILRDLARLKAIARDVGPLQIVFAGKAHPRDDAGKEMIRRIVEAAGELGAPARIVYLENYDMDLARCLTAGVDLWLNTPKRPQEASGTSGMKAALNGVPSLSVLDGWWIEGHVEGVTGWSIPDGHGSPDDETDELSALYEKLEREIVPLFYGQPPAYDEIRRSAIALNAAFFNTQRMLSQYLTNAYFPRPHTAEGSTA